MISTQFRTFRTQVQKFRTRFRKIRTRVQPARPRVQTIGTQAQRARPHPPSAVAVIPPTPAPQGKRPFGAGSCQGIFRITFTAAYNPATCSRKYTLGGYLLFKGCSLITSSPAGFFSKNTRLNVVE